MKVFERRKVLENDIPRLYLWSLNRYLLWMHYISKYGLDPVCQQSFSGICGIRSDGFREILGARVADGEDELTWEDLVFLRGFG